MSLTFDLINGIMPPRMYNINGGFDVYATAGELAGSVTKSKLAMSFADGIALFEMRAFVHPSCS